MSGGDQHKCVSRRCSTPRGGPCPSKELPDSASGSVPPTSPVCQAGNDRDGPIRVSFQERDFSAEVAGFLLSSWQGGTKRQYGGHIERWMSFCVLRQADPFQPAISDVLDFMFLEFKRGKGRGYSSMNTLRSALSSVASVEGTPVGKHPFVRRFMRAVFQERPAFPKYQFTWDPDLVLSYIRSLGINRNISTIMLSRKLTMLLLLLSGQRHQTLHLFDIRNMSLTKDYVIFRLGDLLKTSRPGQPTPEVVFPAYPLDRKLCVVTTVRSYIKRTRDTRGNHTRLLLTSRSPVSIASRDTIRRWARDIMKAAGVDMAIFAPYSTKSASVSKAGLTLPIDTIVRTIGWSGDSMYGKYYKKPIVVTGQYAAAVLA